MVEEIIRLKAEIFDIIRQQELYMANANNLQQKRVEKTQELKNAEQKGSLEDIMRLKSQAYDIIVQQDAYIAAANNMQQTKIQKLQVLNEMEMQQMSQTSDKQITQTTQIDKEQNQTQTQQTT